MAGGLRGEGDDGGGGGGLVNDLGLDEDGDNLAGLEAKPPVVEDGQDAANLARVAGDADPGVVVVGENIIEDNGVASHLASRSLALADAAAPQLVLLGEALLKGKLRGNGGNVGFVGAAVAGVDGDALAEQLLDDGSKGPGGREGEVGEGALGGLDATGEGRRVVGLEVGHAVLLEARPEEGVGLGSLGVALGGQLGVGPDGGAVAVELSPVALEAVLEMET